jgi:photosystem II stability/assembly factor-like uncharacterized protein
MVNGMIKNFIKVLSPVQPELGLLSLFMLAILVIVSVSNLSAQLSKSSPIIITDPTPYFPDQPDSTDTLSSGQFADASAQSVLLDSALSYDWHWQNPFPTGVHLNDVSISPTGIVTAVGWIGSIIATANQGTTWNNFNSTEGVRSPLYTVSMVEDTGYVCGGGGTVLKTLDGGKDWSRTVPPNTGMVIFASKFISGDTGWIAGSNGLIYKTEDGGTFWTLQYAAHVTIRGIDFIDSQNGWVVGDSGKIFATTDGGSSWTNQLNNTYSLSSVHFATPLRGWAAGVGGVIRRTVNGGAAWVMYPTGTGVSLNSIYFLGDSTTGWVVGANGVIRKSTNGE